MTIAAASLPVETIRLVLEQLTSNPDWPQICAPGALALVNDFDMGF
ncbi:hypothetical protein [Pseudomonas asplenii]|nr:hypothetical protein [Pseudomonas fuscovaginae]